ncbi:MAG: glutamine synthetase, partial [Proteobacteria bacterium]
MSPTLSTPEPKSESERDRVLSELRKDPGSKVKVAVCDIDGVLRGKYLHKSKVLSALESHARDAVRAVAGDFGLCNVVFGWDVADVCYDNGAFSGWHTGFPDAPAYLDLATFRHVPWDRNVPFFLGDLDCDVCPRTLLRHVLDRAATLGIVVKAGMEFEWFNFRETPASLAEKEHRAPRPLTPGMFGYSLLRMAQNSEYFNALFDELGAFGVPLEGLHTETGPGVTEAAILFDDALECADRAVLFKAGTKEIAARFGILPSFMAKWSSELPGTSGHI